MASLTQDKGSTGKITWRVGFDDPGGRRRTIRLGAVPQIVAEDYRRNIEHLVACRNSPELIADKVLKWATNLDSSRYGRLVRVGLLPDRDGSKMKVTKLGAFLDRWKSAQTFKTNTEIFYRNTIRLLLQHFGANRALESIRAEDADAFKAWMAKQHKLAPATVGRRIGAARTIWKAAARWELVAKNPWEGIPVGTQSNADRKQFISREQIEKVMEAAPDAEWRLIIALSRFGGLRCPSEHFSLNWRDVDWDKGTVAVTCPKLAHNPKYARRIVPLFSELRPYLLAVFEEAPEGSEFVISRHRLGGMNLRTQFLRIIRTAGIQSWPRLFHNLRASRESELMREFDLATACSWIGNSPKIAAEHYAVAVEKDADFRRAVGQYADSRAPGSRPQIPATAAQQKAAQNPTRTGVNLSVFEGTAGGENLQKNPENTPIPRIPGVKGMGRAGIEPATQGFSVLCSTS